MPTAAELEEALAALLSPHERTGDLYRDAVAGVRRALERRSSNSRDGGCVIASLRDRGMTWREIEDVTGLPKDTAQRWAEPPGGGS